MKQLFSMMVWSILASGLFLFGVPVATGAEAWFGGGYYDGFHASRGLGAADHPQVNNAMGATAVNSASATLNGILVATGSVAATVSVYWAQEDGGKDVQAWAAAPGAGVHVFASAELFTLLSHTLAVQSGADYYYRFFASNSAGESGWAPESSFFQIPASPLVSTGPGAGVGITTAGLHVELTAGIEAQIWLEWGATDSGVVPSTFATIDMGVRTVAGTPEVPNPYRQRIDGLAPATTYAYRIRATNNYGTDESEWVWFTTMPSDFIVTGDEAWFGGGYFDGYDWSEDQVLMEKMLRGTILKIR